MNTPPEPAAGMPEIIAAMATAAAANNAEAEWLIVKLGQDRTRDAEKAMNYEEM
jgi:hypothetical protein